MDKPQVNTPEAAKDYLDALAKRKARAQHEGRINNSTLYAGSPMYFYCAHCGINHETLPEGYITPPKKFCDACQEMIDRGYSVSLGKFPGITVT